MEKEKNKKFYILVLAVLLCVNNCDTNDPSISSELSLKLEEVGSIVSKYFSPTAIIHKSKPSPPVRIYAGRT